MIESARRSSQVRSISGGPASVCLSVAHSDCRRSMRRPIERKRQPGSRVMPSSAKPDSVANAAIATSSSPSSSESGERLPRRRGVARASGG